MTLARRISTDRFRFSARDRLFAATREDLRDEEIFGYLWPRSIDRGFIMISSKTGALIYFVWVGNKCSPDGKTLWHIFVGMDAYGEALRGVLAGTECRVYLD